jgi:hypothetical protein
MVESAGESGLGREAGLELVPERVQLGPGGSGQHGPDAFDGGPLRCRLPFLTGTLLEEWHVTGFGLDQVVREDELEGAGEVDLMLQMGGHEEGHQRHLERVLGHALPPTIGEPRVAQLALQALGKRQEVENQDDLRRGRAGGRHRRLLSGPW